MMCKKTSSRWSAAKALLVLPLVAVSLAATATTVYVPREVQDKVTENSVNEQPEKSSVVKISKGKIYLNGEKITIEELKAKVAEWDSVTIEADKNVKMGDVAELKEALRENGTLKVNYLVSEDEAVVSNRTQQKKESEQEKDQAYIMVEKMPTFQGGDLNVFRNWVQSKIQYPKEAMDKGIKGRVVCSFVVEKDGSLTDFDVLQSPDKSLADEVVRILKTSPKWEPGEQRGEKVRVKYTVPIVFSIAD